MLKHTSLEVNYLRYIQLFILAKGRSSPYYILVEVRVPFYSILHIAHEYIWADSGPVIIPYTRLITLYGIITGPLSTNCVRDIGEGRTFLFFIN